MYFIAFANREVPERSLRGFAKTNGVTYAKLYHFNNLFPFTANTSACFGILDDQYYTPQYLNTVDPKSYWAHISFLKIGKPSGNRVYSLSQILPSFSKNQPTIFSVLLSSFNYEKAINTIKANIPSTFFQVYGITEELYLGQPLIPDRYGKYQLIFPVSVDFNRMFKLLGYFENLYIDSQTRVVSCFALQKS